MLSNQFTRSTFREPIVLKTRSNFSHWFWSEQISPRKVPRLAGDCAWWSEGGALECSWRGSCQAGSSHCLFSRQDCESHSPPPVLPHSSAFQSPRWQWYNLVRIQFISNFHMMTYTNQLLNWRGLILPWKRQGQRWCWKSGSEYFLRIIFFIQESSQF